MFNEGVIEEDSPVIVRDIVEDDSIGFEEDDGASPVVVVVVVESPSGVTDDSPETLVTVGVNVVVVDDALKIVEVAEILSNDVVEGVIETVFDVAACELGIVDDDCIEVIVVVSSTVWISFAEIKE